MKTLQDFGIENPLGDKHPVDITENISVPRQFITELQHIIAHLKINGQKYWR